MSASSANAAGSPCESQQPKHQGQKEPELAHLSKTTHPRYVEEGKKKKSFHYLVIQLPTLGGGEPTSDMEGLSKCGPCGRRSFQSSGEGDRN